MMSGRPLQAGMLCYPRLTQLDLTGPYEVLSRMPDAEVHILWKDTAPVKTEGGFCIVPTRSLRESLESGRPCGARRSWAAGSDGRR
jgi:cyclohexyl-isocyanide hydratase